tara:strand:- start:19 stop:258 length:240 start_codon:yes stop_codon:yes gene_type:complete
MRGMKDQTLVVETDLSLPRSRTYADTSREFENLVDYLTSIADSEFNEFSKLEIKSYKAENEIDPATQAALQNDALKDSA